MLDIADLFLFVLVLGVALLWTRWSRWGQGILTCLVVLFALLLVFPVGEWLVDALETRIREPSSLPGQVSGIVVAPGVLDRSKIAARSAEPSVAFSSALQTVSEFANRYRTVIVAFCGPKPAEGLVANREVQKLLESLAEKDGRPDRVAFVEAKRLSDCATKGQTLLHPGQSAPWLLLSPAYQLPRTYGVFTAHDWPVIPVPTHSLLRKKNEADFHQTFAESLILVSSSTREWLLLCVAWFLGNTSELFPKFREIESA